MRVIKNNRTKTLKAIFCGLVFVQIFSVAGFAQNSAGQTSTVNAANAKMQGEKVSANITLPQVTQIDASGLGKLLKPNGKPVLINFWATWCGPCVEEFPELVKINSDYKGKIDVAAVSLDDVEELNRAVPQFLAKVKSEIPAYLLKTPDEDTAIENVDKSWAGALPFTILINTDGTIVYKRQGIINPKILREEIDKILVK